MRDDELTDVLGVATRAIDGADTVHPDAHDLLHAVDRLLEAGVALQRHLVHDPGARVDRHGRCHQCGRLLALPPRPSLGAGKRGCAFLPTKVVAQARWATNVAMSVPYVGKMLWLMLRRGSA